MLRTAITVFMVFTALITLTAGEAPAAPDVSQPVDVPDPVGLGERLALIDWLQERKITVANRDDLSALRLAYLKAAKPTLFTDPEAAQKEAVALDLWQRHGVNADRKESLASLTAMLAELDQRKGATDAAERQRQLALSGAGPRSSAPRAPAAVAPAPARPTASPTPPAAPAHPTPPSAATVAGDVAPAPAMQFSPRETGHIAGSSIIGHQSLVWKRNNYEITDCRKTGPGVYVVTFAEGTLKLKRVDSKNWDVYFTAKDSSVTSYACGGEGAGD
jgi:hypothetical protein